VLLRLALIVAVSSPPDSDDFAGSELESEPVVESTLVLGVEIESELIAGAAAGAMRCNARMCVIAIRSPRMSRGMPGG
jgi:hypothetical protein